MSRDNVGQQVFYFRENLQGYSLVAGIREACRRDAQRDVVEVCNYDRFKNQYKVVYKTKDGSIHSALFPVEYVRQCTEEFYNGGRKWFGIGALV